MSKITITVELSDTNPDIVKEYSNRLGSVIRDYISDLGGGMTVSTKWGASRTVNFGTAIEQAIITAAETGEFRTRKDIATEVGCTLSRVSEVLTAMLNSNDENRIAWRNAYVGMGESIKAQAREAKQETAAAKKAEKVNAPLEGKAAYDEAKRILQEAKSYPDEELLAAANAYAKKAKRARLGL